MENDASYGFVQPHLISGEYILWRGKPDKGRLLSISDIYAIPFSVLWCGGVCYGAYTSLRSGISFATPFLLLFVAVGLYISVGRFIHMAWLRKHTYYVITNLKVVRLRNRRVNMIMGSNLPSVTVEIYKNGNGTIRIGQPTSGSMRGTALYRQVRNEMLTLENIPDVARVQRYLTQISSQ